MNQKNSVNLAEDFERLTRTRRDSRSVPEGSGSASATADGSRSTISASSMWSASAEWKDRD